MVYILFTLHYNVQVFIKMVNVTLRLYLYLVFSCVCFSDYVRKASSNGSSNFASRSNANVSQILQMRNTFTASSGAPGTHFFLEIRELWADPRFLMGIVARGLSAPGNWRSSTALISHSAGILDLSPHLLMVLKAHIQTRWYFIVFSASTSCLCLNYLPLVSFTFGLSQ